VPKELVIAGGAVDLLRAARIVFFVIIGFVRHAGRLSLPLENKDL